MKSWHFLCWNPAVTKWNPCKEMVIMMLVPQPLLNPQYRDFLAFIICPRKFQNVRKNQLPFWQHVRYWFWSSWITVESAEEEWMTIENIWWSISTKECCWPGGGRTRNLVITSRNHIQLSHGGWLPILSIFDLIWRFMAQLIVLRLCQAGQLTYSNFS